MNFPIYRNDYDFSLEEIYRYLKYFPRHGLYLSVPRSRFYQEHVQAETIHEYPDGLSIRLFWKANIPERVHPGHSNMTVMMRKHKQKEFSLKGFEIREFSKEYGVGMDIPDERTREIFEDFVMHGRKPIPYTKDKYEEAEFHCKYPPTLSEDFFESFVSDMQNKIDFEKFYSNWKKASKDKS